MNKFLLAVYLIAAGLSPNAFSQDAALPGRQIITNSKNGKNPSDISILQPNPNFGCFEEKVTDATGKITQWYQHFVDADGKEIIMITRQTVGNWKPPYESIQFITSYSYNTDGNVTEAHEFFGDGTLKHRVVYRYDKDGKWLVGMIYDASGKTIGRELTPPEVHLYGKKQQ